MWTITRLTIREFINKKIFIFMAAVTFLYIGMFYYGIDSAVKEMVFESNDLQDMAMRNGVMSQLFSLGLFFGTFILAVTTIFSASGTISADVDTGIIQGLITKPIKRSSYFLGKCLGNLIVSIIFATIIFLSMVFITHHLAGFEFDNIVLSMFQYWLIPLVFVSITVFGSVFLPTLANSIIGAIIFILGMIGGFIGRIGVGIENEQMISTGVYSSIVSPADAIYREVTTTLLENNSILDSMEMNPFTNADSAGISIIIIALLYSVTFISGGIYKFKNKEL